MTKEVWDKLTNLSEKYGVSKAAIVSIAVVRYYEIEMSLTKLSLRAPKIYEENHGNGHADVPR